MGRMRKRREHCKETNHNINIEIYLFLLRFLTLCFRICVTTVPSQPAYYYVIVFKCRYHVLILHLST